MTQPQDNILNMINAVLNLFGQNPQAAESIPLIARQVEDIRCNRDDILFMATKQKSSNSKGFTEAKERSRSMLMEKIFIVGVRLRTFAAVTDNDVVAAPLTFTRSKLGRMKNNELLTLGRIIVELASNCLDALDEYKINAAMLDDLSANIEEMSTLYAERDTAVDGGMEATAQLVRLFKSARRLLKQMDDLVDGYITDSTFVAIYHNSRKVHDL